MHPSRRFQEFHMDRNIFPPPPSTSSGNPVGDGSRNNFIMSDQPSHSPATVMGFGFSRGASDNLNGLCRNGVVNGFSSNQPEEFLNSRNPYESGCQDQNNFVAPWWPNESNLHETSGNAVYTSSLGQVKPVQWEQLSLAKGSTMLPQLQGHVNQLKAYESSEISPKSHIEGQVQDFPRFGQSGQLNSNFNASGDLPKPSSNQPLLVQNLQNRSLDPRLSSVGVIGQVCSQESSNIQVKSGVYKGLYSSNPLIDGRNLAEFHNEHVNDIFVQNQLHISSGCAGGFSTSNSVKGDTEIEKTLSSAASGLIQSFKKETSAKMAETDLSIHGHNLKNEERISSIKTDDNVASKASEKLWNGTLQLSSSVKLSATAYFRSGDKMPDIYWSDSVEVKGKVRLEAFEKYIQDLPRSHNRGLMVMSLRLREGSSKDELQGMNEVIKKYKSGKRVGLARLSSGVDVYICPNSETIITILAKNGFSDDLVTVQDYQDPLIGCVVWRKNTSSDPGSRKVGNESLSGQLSSSSPNSNPQQVTGSDSSFAKPKAEANLLLAHPSSSSSPSPGASTNLHSSSIMDGQAFPPSDLHAIHNIVKQLTDIEANILQSLGMEKHQGNLQLLRTILPSSSEAVKQPAPDTEDDDLPEYDFGASSSNHLEANANNKTLNGEEFRPSNEVVASSQMCVEAQKDIYGGPLPQKRKVQVVDSVHERERPIMTTTTQAKRKTTNLFDEDDMPEWTPPDMSRFKPSTDQTTRLPFVSNTFRPPHSGAVTAAQMALPPPPPRPPQPPPFRPVGRPQHRPYNNNTRESTNHNRWSRR